MKSEIPFRIPSTFFSQEHVGVSSGVTDEFFINPYNPASFVESAPQQVEQCSKLKQNYGHFQYLASYDYSSPTNLFQDHDTVFNQQQRAHAVNASAIEINAPRSTLEQKFQEDVPFKPTQSSPPTPRARQVVEQELEEEKVGFPEKLARCEIDELVKQKIVSHVLEKKGRKGKRATYGNDEISKKIIRMQCALEVEKFKQFCNDKISTDLDERTQQLSQYLGLNHGITVKALENEDNMKLAKELYFPLKAKRGDSIFGESKEKRGQEARNAFLRRGTKKEAKIFFSLELGRKIFYSNFKAILEEYMKSVSKNGQHRLQTFLTRLENGLFKVVSKQ